MSSQNYSGGQFPRPDNRFSAAAAANQPYHMQRPSVSGSTDSVGSIANSMQNLHVSRPMAPLFTPAGARPVNAGIPGFQPPNQGPVAVNAGLPGSQPQNQGPVPVTSVARPAPATIFTAPSATRPVPLTRSGPPPAFAPASNAVRPGPPGAPINTAARPGPPTTAVTRPGPPTRPPFGSAGPLTAPPSKVNASTTVTPTSGAPSGPFSTELTNGSSASIQGAYSSPSQFPPNSNAMVQPFTSSSQIRGPPAVQPSSAGLGRAPQIQGQRLPSPATFPSAPPPATFPSAPPPGTFPTAPPPGTFPTAPPPGTFPSATLPPTSLASTAGSIPPFQAPSFGAQQPGYPVFSPVRPVASAPGVPGMPSFRGPHQHVPPVPPSMGYLSGAGVMGMPQPGSPATGTSATSRIDPNQIPRPQATSDALVFETRVNNEANLPPPASSEFIARDTGNCSPRYMRCTLNQIPCTGDLANTSGMPLALMVQPFALPHPSEEAIQVVDFGESGPVRCSHCKAYINPFMRFIDQGRRFICNLCGCNNETPRDYHCNLGPDGRRRDADVRPELCRGAVEFVATREYMVREPMPPVFFFLIDVSMNAIKTGATAAACSAISRAIEDLAENPRVKVGIASFDSTIHFYSLNTSLQQPSMLVIPDVQDVYTPLETDLIVPISECRQLLEQLLESIPSLFKDSKVPESAFGAAIKGAFLALKISGGKLLVFQSVLPSVGIGALSAREAEGRVIISAGEKEAHKLLQPADKTFKTMSIEFAEFQVCVDLFLTSQIYVDIASISTVPRTTGGQVYYYHPFSAITDSAKLYNDLRWNITRPQGFEAVMRVRSSQGLQVQEYYGNFCKRIPTDVDLPAIDCDKTIMVTFKHDDKFQEGSECCFQCALLYTTTFGERRIRVTTLSLPCTSVLGNLFRGADLDAQFTYFLKQAANSIPTTPLVQLREQATNLCVNILHTYRKYCATASSSGQLILPEGLKFLPLYELALTKSIGLRANVRVDDRSYWLTRVASLSTPLAVPLVYPRMFAVHKLSLKDSGEGVLPQTLPLSSENLDSDGAFLLENGEDAFIYLGKSVNSDILQKLFGVNSMEEIPDPYLLQQHDNDLSRRLNDIVNEIRRQRCSYLRLRLCKRGDNSDFLFLSSMVEDKNNHGTSYVDYLVHIHRQIQAKMSKESQ